MGMPIYAKQAGQAVIEYLIIFAFLSLITLTMARSIGGFLGDSFGAIGFALTQKLSTGVCASLCFDNSFENRIDSEDI